jgi:general secretion pathway protein A
LRERPFDLSPNPRFLFLSSGHRSALTHLKYGLSGRPGLTVLVGEAGTGKTTLVMAALRALNGHTPSQIVHLSNPTLTREEFYEYVAAGFGFSSGAGRSKAQFLRELAYGIGEAAKAGLVMALVVDEAQSLPHELLEEIRLLTNLETAANRSLAVAMVGQPELGDRLNDTSLRQLKQRIALRCALAPLTLQETAAYIAARVRVAGGSAELLFTREAVQTIHQHARGIPRTISVICDNALVNGFAVDLKPVDRNLVLEVCRDFQFADQADTPRNQTPALQPVQQKAPVTMSAPSVDQPAAAVDRPSPGPEVAPREGLFSSFVRRKRFSFFEG